MKLQLNGGDWATVAFFALAVTLGCYARKLPESIPSIAPNTVARAAATDR